MLNLVVMIIYFDKFNHMLVGLGCFDYFCCFAGDVQD